MRAALLILLAFPLALAACGHSDDASSGGVTPDEQRQLNEAAAATDINATINVTEANEADADK